MPFSLYSLHDLYPEFEQPRGNVGKLITSLQKNTKSLNVDGMTGKTFAILELLSQ